MQPFARSESRLSQRADCEYGRVVRTPPGAAWYSSTASALTEDEPRSQASRNSRKDELCTVRTPRLSRPARSSSPRIDGMPPARCTSSTWYELLGATLHRQGTRRES